MKLGNYMRAPSKWELVAMLVWLETRGAPVGGQPTCPWCGRQRDAGHEPTCDLAQLLSRVRWIEDVRARVAAARLAG